MGWVVAGELGAVLVAAARPDREASALIVEGLAEPAAGAHPVTRPPQGSFEGVVVMEAEPATLEAVKAWAASRGLPVEHGRVPKLDVPDGVRVVAVSSVTAGSAKTLLVRKLARTLRRSGVSAVAVRSPLGALLTWPLSGVRVVTDPEELSSSPFDERVQLAPVVGAGVPVVTGTDPSQMLARAVETAGVVVVECGGAARPWLQADVDVLVVDALRPPPDGAAERVAAADAVVIAKSDAARHERVAAWEDLARDADPGVRVTLCDVPLAIPHSVGLRRRDVAVVEDWPALLLGGLKAGAGAVVARRWGCGVVDPRPFAVGAVADALGAHPHVGAVVPALGRTPGEVEDLRSTVEAMPAEVVLWASAASPEGVVDPARPLFRVYPELMEVAGTPLPEVLRPLMPGS